MNDSSQPDRSPLLHHLHALLEAAPGTHTVVFVAQKQLGNALRRAVGRLGPVLGLRCTTVEDYAKRLAKADLLYLALSGTNQLDVDLPDTKRPLLSGIDQMLAAYAVDQLPVETRNQLLQGSTTARLSGSLAKTFSELRKHGVQPEAYQQALKAADKSTAQQEAQAKAYQYYVGALTENKYYDDADILQHAIALVQENTVHEPRQSQYAILDDVDVPGYARKLVEALTAASPHPLRRLGQEHPTKQAPVLSAAKVFPDAPLPARPKVGPTAQAVHASERGAAGNGTGTLYQPEALRFCTTVGRAEEVRTVFRDIQQRGLKFDQVEIAFTATDPYLSIIEQQAQRHGIGITLSTGRHLHETRPGQALLEYLDWLAGPQEAAPFIHMLRAGHLTLRRNKGLTWSDAKVATWLAEHTYKPGVPSLLNGVERRIQHAEEQDYTNDAQIGQWKHLYKSLYNLLEDLPSGLSDVRTMAKHCETFLTQYGPTDKPGDPASAALTFDEKARGRILQYLNKLKRSEGDVYRDSPIRLADYIRTWVREKFIDARHPQPGEVHVVPLQTVGYANRPHLYVVGMDAESLSVTLSDDPLLSDADRRRLNEHEQITLPLTANRRQEEDWRVRQALLRHHGDATFVMHRFDLRSSEERFPSTLYLQLRTVVQAALGHAPEQHHALTVSDAQDTLDALDAWGLTEQALSDAKRGIESAPDYLTRTAPHILHGRAAEEACASDEVTAYDGLLQDPPYPKLDLLDPDTDTIASASRLEMFARTPYLYFVKYVLEAEPLDEPALDDEDWLDPLTRGTILHRTYELFLNPEDGGLGRMPTLDDEQVLWDAFETAFEEATQQRGTPPNEQVEAAAREGLRADVNAFLRADAARGTDHPDLEPKRFEWSFGNRPRDEHPEVELATERGTLRLRGAVDRIDHLNGDALIWDYKTGGMRDYDPLDGLRNKRWSLQWMLYARAVEEALGLSVSRSGYYFATARQMGRTVAYPPDSTGDSHPDTYREDLQRILNTLSEMAREGVFAPSGDSLKQSDWRYNYTPLVYDRRTRRDEIQAKPWPDNLPHLHHD
ncbi:PD-(D/E)XK nuclease family protein [Longimonas halophila]|nr:PD-(D/E)XK nuclease family protein [Longimonas halophila]